MNFRLCFLLLAGSASAAKAPPPKPASDVASPEHRRTIVQTADHLARPVNLPALPANLVSPFSPPNFNQPDPSEVHEKAPVAAATDAKAPPAPLTDRELLETVAAKIPTTGTIILDGTPMLVSGTNRLQVGSRFTVVYNGQEYELELVAIQRTMFTLRYKGEEFTRPIKLGRTP